MKIESITISNFRGIKFASAKNLGATVIVAGQNGSGKSCIFDSIRLLKSLYGGYQQNEWHHWMGEFQINLNSPNELMKIFNDRTTRLSIECLFELDDEERAFMSANAEQLLTDATWKAVLPDAFAYGNYRLAMFAAQFREKEPEVKARVADGIESFLAELAAPYLIAHFTVDTNGSMGIKESLALQVIFSDYRPNQIGVIDYHGAQRHYGREQVQAVNINLDQAKANQSNHALYNYANKYANVKSEMAGSYIKEILAEQAGLPKASQSSLTNTLRELFETFFPDKKFDGPIPTPDGNLSFPVKTASGSVHDLDDLSAGEKEILYGYLRIRNSAPRYSIILLDEPELHLNPRLIRGLPQFYRKNLGEALKNQIWLVSHSDALLREAVGKPGFDVFHMQPAGSIVTSTGFIATQQNQLKPVALHKDVDIATTDLVGDLAAYQPGRKAVLFEGGGDTDFDQWMTSRLFPELTSTANLISGSNKSKVKALHEVLERAFERGELFTEFFAIVDRDYDEPDASGAVRRFAWDVYHIENYLLEPDIILKVVAPLYQVETNVDDVAASLRECARLSVPKAVRHAITEHANHHMIRSINLRFDPLADDAAGEVHKAALRSLERLLELRDGLLSEEKLRQFEEEARQQIEASFGDGSWRKTLPGREILRAYANTLPNGISYETMRNMIVNKMADEGVRPQGMADIVAKILNPPSQG